MTAWIVLLGWVIAFTGCSSPTVVSKPPAARPKLERVAIQKLDGKGGADVSAELTLALEGSGLIVVEAQQKPDAFLQAYVFEHRAGRKLMVFLGTTRTVSKDQTLTTSNPIMSLSGGQVVPQTPTSGGEGPRVVAENAMVGVLLKLVDASGRVIWVDQYNYEALELATARKAVIRYLARSLKRAWPSLQSTEAATAPS